jgi:acyl-CoA dehydrogenase
VVRKFVEEEVNPHADEWEQQESFPRSLFLRGGELKLFAHGAQEEYGGTGIDSRMAIVMSEELSRGHTRGVGMGFGAHNEIAKPHLVRFGTDAQKSRYLRDLIAGRKVGALAITEPTAGSNVSAIKTTATRAAKGWTLDGEKIFITNGPIADVYFVAAKTAPAKGHRGISMFLFDRQTPGFSVETMHGKLGRRSSQTGYLKFDRCPRAGRRAVGSGEPRVLPDHAMFRARAAGDRGRCPRVGRGVSRGRVQVCEGARLRRRSST